MPKATPSVALHRGHQNDAAVKLTKTERSILAEALRRGEDLGEEIEAKVMGYGRWLLSAIYEDDTKAALDAKTKNAVWSELVRRAGGPTLRVSRTLLYVTLRIAAYDKRITDQAWRGLDAGRKERLLPLGDVSAMRDAAKHVSEFNLSQVKTREYVTELMHTAGKARQVRVTPKQLGAHARKLRELIGRPAVLQRIASRASTMTEAERAALATEFEKLTKAAAHAAKVVRGKR